MEKENFKNKTVVKNKLLIPSHGFPTDFPSRSTHSIPSLLSTLLFNPLLRLQSIKTGSSDEDEFLTGLTHRLAHSTSQKLTVRSLSLDKTEKTRGLASSPRSTLSGLGSWSASLIYAVADQIARLKMSNEVPKCTNFNYDRGLLKTQNHAFMKNSSFGLYSSQSFL